MVNLARKSREILRGWALGAWRETCAQRPTPIVPRFGPATLRSIGGPLSVVLLMATACSSSDTAGPPLPATTHEEVKPEDFAAMALGDSALLDVIAEAKTEFGVEAISRAGRISDSVGESLDYATLVGDGDLAVRVVRRCDGEECVSAVESVDEAGNATWLGLGGELPVREIGRPLQYRELDVEESYSVRLPTLSSAPDGDHPDSSAPPRIDVLSAFNKYVREPGSSLEDLVALSSGQAAFETTVRHGATVEDLDLSLSSRRQSDVVVVITYGDARPSLGRVVGIAMNQDFWGAIHYPEPRMRGRLAANSRGGPGLLILAGCQTADLLETLDSPTRVTVGVSGKVPPLALERGIRSVIEALTSNKTLGEALAAASVHLGAGALAVNPSAEQHLGKHLADIGSPPSCGEGILGAWGGATERITDAGASSDFAVYCGSFTLDVSESALAGCEGCPLAVRWGPFGLSGCAEGTQFTTAGFNPNAQREITAELMDDGRLSVTVEGTSADTGHFTQLGSLTRCPPGN